MKTNDSFITSFQKVMKYSRLDSAVLIVFIMNLLGAVISFITLSNDDMGNLHHVLTACYIADSVLPLIAVSSIARIYLLLSSAPIKNVHISKSLIFMLDIIYIPCIIFEIPLYLSSGSGTNLLVDIWGMAILYITSSIGMVIMTNPGMSVRSISMSVKGIIGVIFIYCGMGVGIIMRIASNETNFSLSAKLIVTVAAFVIAAAVARSFSIKTLTSKMRLEKIYENESKNDTKQESYV